MCLILYILKRDFWFAFCQTLRIFAQIKRRIVETRNNAEHPTERSEWSILQCDNNEHTKENEKKWKEKE